MQQITTKEVEKLISNKEVQFYNFYNTDIDNGIFFASEHYQNNSESDTEQFMHTIFLDIEVYQEDKSVKFDFDRSIQPVNAISFYDNKSGIIHSYFLTYPFIQPKLKQLEETVTEYSNWLVDNKYYNKLEDIKLDLNYYTNEKELIKACWEKIRQIDPMTLSGFSSDTFDYPYLYKRCLILFPKEEVPSIFSRFNYVELRNKFLKIPDYPIVDLLYLYKPRDEGGMALGTKRNNYKLDNIARLELKLKKIEHEQDFNLFYENNPYLFFLYNIVDVILCKLLNEKLKHIELLNTLRRMMKIPFSNCLIGNSALFEGYAFHELSLEKKFVRYGLIHQYNKSIDVSQLKNIPKPATKKNEVTPISILSREYSAIVTKFDGAYVKQPKQQIVKGTIIDLDAASLYPSKIIESNIGFDTFKLRIINPITYKLLQQLEQYIGIKPIPVGIYNIIFSLVDKYADNNSISSKLKFKKACYYTLAFLINKLAEYNIPLNKIYNPSTDIESYILAFYLVPILDVFNTIHPEREAYNPFVYEYVFGDEKELQKKYPILYVLNNCNESNIEVIKLTCNETIELMQKYSITMCGTCFLKHDQKLGLFSTMLLNMSEMRTNFRAELHKHEKGSKEFNFFNSRQNAIKVVSNSNYGVMGMSGFRYSNFWIAQTITTQGKLTLKISQYLTENYLNYLSEQKQIE
jgi:DNA polymerase elongation subunit (family B)